MEHDACGVGFVAHLRGEKSRGHRRGGAGAARAADPPRRDRRGSRRPATAPASSCSSRTASSARKGCGSASRCPSRRCYAVGQVFLPPIPAARAACERVFTEVAERRGPAGARLARRPGGRLPAGPARPRARCRCIRQLYVARRRVVPRAFERKLFVIRKLVENRIRARGAGPRAAASTSPALSSETIVYKGLLLPAAAGRASTRTCRTRGRAERPRAGALALLHQHLPHLGAGAAVPLHRAQRGDQHPARQPEPPGCTPRRELLQSAKFGGSLDRLLPIIVARARATRRSSTTCSSCCASAAARLPHAMMMMIPEAWEEHAAMDDEPARLLRVLQRAARAVGRAGGHRLHRRLS